MRNPMTRHALLFCALVAVLLCSALLTAAAAAPLIEQIKFDGSGDVDRVTFQLNSTAQPKAFTLKAPPRLALDFPETALKKGVKTNLPANGKFVKGIRLAEYRGANAKTRVVLDLAAEKGIEYRQEFNAGTTTLVVSVFATGTTPAPAAPPVAAPAQPKAAEPVAEKPTAAVKPAVTPPTEPAAKPAAEPVSKPAATPSPEAKTPEPPAAALPKTGPATGKPGDEATVIQPLSEIGQQAAKADGKPPVLYAIEFDKNASKGETINFKLSAFNPPVVFGVEEDSPRIVCFFKDTAAGEQLKDMIEAKGRFVKSIQVGKYSNPANIRVVLELVPNQNYDLQQVFFKEDNMFMIIINTTGEKSPGQ